MMSDKNHKVLIIESVKLVWCMSDCNFAVLIFPPWQFAFLMLYSANEKCLFANKLALTTNYQWYYQIYRPYRDRLAGYKLLKWPFCKWSRSWSHKESFNFELPVLNVWYVTYHKICYILSLIKFDKVYDNICT